MQATVSLWDPPDDSASPTHRIDEAHVVAETDPARWRVQCVRSDVADLPADVTGFELLFTNKDGEHHAGEIQRDTKRKGYRYLRIPRSDDSQQSGHRIAGYPPQLTP